MGEAPRVGELEADEEVASRAETLGVDGAQILVVGDGRSEIWAGAHMGAVMISRLPESAAYQRALHKSLGTNVIVADYTDPRLMAMFTEV